MKIRFDTTLERDIDLLIMEEFISDEAFAKIKKIYERAGIPDHVGFARPDTVHCYNAEVQKIALDWFGKKL